MTRPLTSTSVATKGADALAGSNPSRRKMNGSIDPASVPHITTPPRLRATANAKPAQPGQELAPDDAPPVAQADLAQRHRADDQRRRLRTRVAAARDDERDEQRQHDSPRDLLLEEGDR